MAPNESPYLKVIAEVLKDYPKGLHIKEIAEIAYAKNSTLSEDVDCLTTALNSCLAYNIGKHGRQSDFAKIPNGKGGYKKGIYRLKRKISKAVLTPEDPATSSNFTGKAGEFSVMGELLFRGYNASMMSVDNGIDIIASKDNHYFHIQVKTAYETPTGFAFTLKRQSFDTHNRALTFYVLLCRRYAGPFYRHDYIVMPSSFIESEIAKGNIAGDKMSLRVAISEHEFFLNKSTNISLYANRFDLIK